MQQAYSSEQSIIEGKIEVNELFQYVQQNAENADAYQMERYIYAKILKIGFAAMKGYFAEKGTGDVGDTLRLEDGTIMNKKNQLRSRVYFSVFGKLDVPRTYYYTKGQAGVFPLDAIANIPEHCYSYLLEEWMDLCSIRDSFNESNITLNKLLGIDISNSSFEIINCETSKNYNKFYENKRLPDPNEEGAIQVVQFDGKGVPMIKSEAAKIKGRLGKGEKRQKKKEATVGVDYTVDRNIREPEEVAKNLIYPEQTKQKKMGNKDRCPAIRAQNIRRIASIKKTKVEVMEEIVNDAQRRCSDNKRPWVVVMDGALCLWNAVALVLLGIEWTGILDIIHVVEYLWKVGNALKGEKTPKAKKWVYDHLLLILGGKVGRVIGGLKLSLQKNEKRLSKAKKKAINEAVTYFENHKQWMKYDEYLKEGYPIGSGVVESTCSHTVKNRMEGSGRRWSIRGAESMLLLRSIYTSNDWKEYFREHRGIEGQRMYGKVYSALGYPDDYSLQNVA